MAEESGNIKLAAQPVTGRDREKLSSLFQVL
jgi:hypothetical protein